MQRIEVGFQAYVADGDDPFGAVRDLAADGVVIYVENAGDFFVPADAIADVHSQKVIVRCDKLEAELRRAIGHAHDAEVPGL